MRKLLLAGASALAVAVAAAGVPAARAQWSVFDSTNHVQAVAQVNALRQQIQVMQQQLQQAQQIYGAVSRLPDQALARLGSQLDTSGFRDAVGLAEGMRGLAMDGQRLTSSAQRFLDQNRVYAPAGNDFASTELLRRAQSIANAQGMADGLMRSSAGRIAALRQLEGMLASAPDAVTVAHIQARIAHEQTFVQAQMVQAQALSLWQQAQVRNEAQRREEQGRQEIERLIEEARARGG